MAITSSADGLSNAVFGTLLQEIRTEAATAEIAIWTAGFCLLIVAGSSWRQSWGRRHSDWALASDYGWSIVRIAAVGAIFAVLTFQVTHSGWAIGADIPVNDWFIAHRTPALTTAAVVVTNLGSPTGVALIVVALVGWMWGRNRLAVPPVLLAGTVATAAGVNAIVKLLITRDRPPISTRLVTETSLSYPSGHVAGTVALTGAVLVAYRAHTRLWHYIAAVSAVVIIAVTRVYLGVHWLTDTLAGMLIGTIFVLFSALVADIISNSRTEVTGRRRATSHHG